jgi:hypothetical protein
VKFVYVFIIAFCTIYNTAAQSLAFAAVSMSLKYNIPISVLITAHNDGMDSLIQLSLSELGEVRADV